MTNSKEISPKENSRIYICVNHIAAFQLAMKKMGFYTTVPRLVVGEERYCYACGAMSGPGLSDTYVFFVDLKPIYDQKEIDQQFAFLEDLVSSGMDMAAALRAVALMQEKRDEEEKR